MSTRTARLSGTAFGSLDIVGNDFFIITTTGAATATLPSSFEGHRIYLLLAVDGGDLVITGDFETGTVATFSDIKDALELLYTSTFGWQTISNQGTVVFS